MAKHTPGCNTIGLACARMASTSGVCTVQLLSHLCKGYCVLVRVISSKRTVLRYWVVFVSL